MSGSWAWIQAWGCSVRRYVIPTSRNGPLSSAERYKRDSFHDTYVMWIWCYVFWNKTRFFYVYPLEKFFFLVLRTIQTVVSTRTYLSAALKIYLHVIHSFLICLHLACSHWKWNCLVYLWYCLRFNFNYKSVLPDETDIMRRIETMCVLHDYVHYTVSEKRYF